MECFRDVQQAKQKPMAQLENELQLRSYFGNLSMGDTARSGMADSLAQGILLHIKELAMLLYREQQQSQEAEELAS